MYQAVAWSLNAPAVWLLHEIGMDKGYNKAKEFGLSLTEKTNTGVVALGGLEKESPLTMAAAYSVFANGGTYYQPHLIRKIVDANGAVIVDNTKVKGKRIISEETANEMHQYAFGNLLQRSGTRGQSWLCHGRQNRTTENQFRCQQGE